jgi:transposase-like protein
LVEATAKQLKEFSERDLSEFDPFAVFLDTVHRGGKAFIVALGIDLGWSKKNLGFWEGATENNEICKELLASLEERGLSKRVIFITDGGKGVIKALRDNKMSLTKKQRPLGIRNISGVHSQFQLKMRHSLNFGFQGFILERYL